ncbi:hypothetical protein V8F06_005972 [Rhypophila decipiens]
MTSRPDSSSSTATSQDLLIDFLDIVTTQGAYLVPRADTPVFQESFESRFAATLEQHLDAVSTQQICRCIMYRDAADEWPIGRTPPEIKEKRKAELKAWDELEGATSDGGSDNDDEDKDKSGNNINARVGPGNPVAPDRPRRPRRPCQADWLPTPPLSAKSPLATQQMRKRRRISEEDEEEKERSAKKHVSFAQEVSAAAEDAVPNKARPRRPAG